ncbi:MAG: lamin tail domain-containing protein [Candidatus Marinimicrobia bacterium]|nr:lamin tail domain-containing protein [Candidatus Neomarinimicrobiota bacterium]
MKFDLMHTSFTLSPITRGSIMRNLLRVVLVASIAMSSVFAQATELFFSEYIEGSSNNKALEIYNGTGSAIDLADYQIAQSSNGGGWAFWHVFPGGASIAAGDVWVIVNSSAVIAGMQEASDESLAFPSVVIHNGDDARALVKIVGTDTTWIDIIGVPDVDPGTGWEVAGVTDGTKDHTLVRKSTVTSGTTNWTASAGTDADSSQWIVYYQNFHMLGAHNQAEVPIAAIQFVPQPDSTDASPLDGQVVTISGVVTSEFWGSSSNRYMFVQDAEAAWSGIMLFEFGWDAFDGGSITGLAQGDSVTVTGTVAEYFGMTELIDVTSVIIHGTAMNPPAPMAVTTLAANDEQYESCLVMVTDVDITNGDDGNGEWIIDDGSGPVSVDDRWDYYYFPTTGDSLASITGAMEYTFSAAKLQPRLAADVVEAGEFVRIQRIQQVRGSDLMKAPFDAVSDTSYLRQDTVSVTGVVTMPTGLSFAGDGVKFNLADIHGGPWSGIMFYNPDSTAYPVLYEGDSIKATGWVDEYQTGPSGMTEFWIVGPITVLGVGNSHRAFIVSHDRSLLNPALSAAAPIAWILFRKNVIVLSRSCNFCFCSS